MNKISLCLIVGNVEEYIGRCLKSFAPIADEICLVRAIGAQPPDNTLAAAAATLEELNHPSHPSHISHPITLKTAEYHNRPEHAGWPHVDNFAAARQMSFDLATNEYCFWADSDDVLEKGADIVRELANRGGFAAYLFPYKIMGKGLCLPRERMMLRDAGQWRFPVHECFDFHIKPVQGIEDQRVVVLHLPGLHKTGSNERNLRILKSIPDADMTTGLLYHLHLEQALAGETAASVDTAKKVLARPDLGRPERMEIFLNLAQIDHDPNRKHLLLHQAYMADPRRREALGLLCNNALNFGKPEDALAYARQMLATPPPKLTEWNDRAAIYGWVGLDLYAQALRANGLRTEADLVRYEAMRRDGPPRIALVHATRGRPEKAAMARKIWLDTAEHPELVEHVFCLDDDDETADILERFHHVKSPAGGGCVAAWNLGALTTIAPVLVQLSDDWVPVMHWDKLIYDRLAAAGNIEQTGMVLAISDGARADDLLCMAICTRRYLMRDFFLFHPWFTGVYSDNWFTEQARARGCIVEARDIVFEHRHPIFGSADMDETYARQNAPERYAQGEAVIKELRLGNDWSTVPGYFNYWPFYQRIADNLRDGDTVAEVGVWLGRSVIFLAQELRRMGKRNVKILAIDHFRGETNQPEHQAVVAANGGSIRAAFEANLKRCGVADMISIIEDDSAAAAARLADKSLAFCFIDAAHDYASVKRDVNAWAPKVKPNGLLAGHDAEWPDVAQAVKEILPQTNIVGCLWISAYEDTFKLIPPAPPSTLNSCRVA